MVVPKPFSRAIFLYGPPIIIPRDGKVEEWRQRVEDAMNALANCIGFGSKNSALVLGNPRCV